MPLVGAIMPSKLRIPSPLTRQIGVFAMVGAMGFWVDVSVTLLLTQTLDASPYWAKIPAIICGLLVTFFLNRRFTFCARAGDGMGEFKRYAATCLAAQSTNYLVFSLVFFALERMALLARVWLPESAPIIVAAVAGSGLSAGVTFMMAKFYAFRRD
jgi:putative flippase GtrA